MERETMNARSDTGSAAELSRIKESARRRGARLGKR
jgi:hypothetical protein